MKKDLKDFKLKVLVVACAFALSSPAFAGVFGATPGGTVSLGDKSENYNGHTINGGVVEKGGLRGFYDPDGNKINDHGRASISTRTNPKPVSPNRIKGVTLKNGAQFDVYGIIENSTIEGDGTENGADGTMIRVSKRPTWNTPDDFSEDNAALAEHITATHGSEIQVYAGGQLKNSSSAGLVRIGGEIEGVSESSPKGINLTVQNKGRVWVAASGVLEDSTIEAGGREVVFSKGTSKSSTVYGTQTVQQAGTAFNTQVMEGGKQNVTGVGSTATGTTVKEGGLQNVYSGGKAVGAIIDGGKQRIYGADSSAEGSVLNSGVIDVQGENTTTNTEVKGGTLILRHSAQAIGTELSGTGSLDLGQNQEGIVATDTVFKDKAWGSIGKKAKLLGDTNLHDDAQIHLFSAKSGEESAYAKNVILHGGNASLFAIASGENAQGTLNIGDVSGVGKIVFNSNDKVDAFTHLTVDKLEGKHQIFFNTAFNKSIGDYLTIKDGSGEHGVTVADSGSEITEIGTNILDIITDESAGADFTLQDVTGSEIKVVDGGVYQFELANRDESGEKIWYLTADGEAPKPEPEPEPEEPGDNKPTPPIKPTPKPSLRTTPGADAVMAMASSAQLLFNNELGNLRFRRGEVRDNVDNSGAWGRVISDRTKVYPLDGKFTLTQTGIELGHDKTFTYADNLVLVGGFLNYSDNEIKHDRGGKSSMDSVSLGIYGTSFFDSGAYLDGVVKYAHYRGKLDARSTNGQSIKGNFRQNGLGFSLEGGHHLNFADGYFAEPYARLSYASFSGRSFSLSNDMHANMKRQDTLQTEFGTSAGKRIATSNGYIKPYAKIAWAYEYMDNNDVVLNRRHTFNNDFSGSIGKYGLGVDVNWGAQSHFFTELNYRKGKRTESSHDLTIGVEYNF